MRITLRFRPEFEMGASKISDGQAIKISDVGISMLVQLHLVFSLVPSPIILHRNINDVSEGSTVPCCRNEADTLELISRLGRSGCEGLDWKRHALTAPSADCRAVEKC